MINSKEGLMEDMLNLISNLKTGMYKCANVQRLVKISRSKIQWICISVERQHQNIRNDVNSPPKLIQHNKYPIYVVDNCVGSLLSIVSCILTRVFDEYIIIKSERERER